jgi:DNA-binding CsgD family transcriptional regulator
MLTHYFTLRKLTRPMVCLFVLVGALCYCVPKKEAEKDLSEFFQQPRFKGDFWKTYPLLPMETFAKRIATEIEPQYHSLVCETAYYKLDEIPNLPDSNYTYLHLLDAYDQYFQRDTIRWLTQKLRGLIMIDINNLDSARVCLDESYVFAQKSHDALRVADVNLELAALTWRRLAYAETIDRLLDVYDEFSKLSKTTEKGRTAVILRFTAKVYQSMGDYEAAKKWFQKYWAYTHSSEGTMFERYRVIAAPLLANNYLSLNQLDSARALIDVAFRYQAAYKTDDAFKFNRYAVLGKIEVKEGKGAAALAHTKTAALDNPFKENIAVVSELNKGLADAYVCVGQRDSAVLFYNKALVTPDSAFQSAIYADLSKLYSQTGNYAQALAYEQKSRALHDHTFTIEKQNEIGRIEAKHQHEKVLSHLDNKTQERERWLMGILLTFAAVSIVYALDVSKKRKGYQQEKERIESRARLQTRVLMQTQEDLARKEADLADAQQLVSLKNTLIDALQNDKDAQSLIVKAPMFENDIQQFRRIKILTKEDWRRFRNHFDSVFPHFNAQLRQQYGDLTNAERRLLILIKVGFDTNDVVYALGISIESVYKSRYRLRKKLGLSDQIDLEAFVQAFEV